LRDERRAVVHMPGWETHFISGLFLVVAFLALFQAYFFPSLLMSAGIRPYSAAGLSVMLVLVLTASLFPDIDIGNSKIRNVFSLAIAGIVSAAYVLIFPSKLAYGFPYFFLLYIILRHMPTKHRGLTHSFGFSVLFSLSASILIFFFDPSLARMAFWAAVTMAGYNVHLLLDRI
jgi:membrane-bound metal-dependent hydrolase YbcI (DUF457 family)